MTFRPALKNKNGILVAVISAVFSIMLILISGITNRFGGLYQISAIVFGVIAVEFYLKYVGSDYIYEAADDYFKIYKVTGKKSICVSSLDYEMSLSHVLSCKEYIENKDKLPKTNFNVNLCKNLAPADYSVYFFEFDEKKCMMKFEPDEVFTNYINGLIDRAWDSREETDEDY